VRRLPSFLTFRLLRRALAVVPALAFGLISYGYLALPDVRPLGDGNPGTTALMQLRADQARAQGRSARRLQRWVSLAHVSPDLRRAVLVAEDSAFWQHQGIDLEQMRESLEIDLERWSFARGASTITQQLAKNLYLSPSKNPVRKIAELAIARRLEAELSKRRILEIYLNVIEWGDGVYGVEAAARLYFHKPAAALGPDESAMLAACIVNPRLVNPSRPSGRLVRRQRLILQRMTRSTASAARFKAAAQTRAFSQG
jgi:monofunctional biosynthetic peptidoglycan transglycosylase